MLLLSTALAYSARAQEPKTPSVMGDVAGFKATIVPYLQQHCVKCHGAEKPKGKLSLHNIDGDVVNGPDVEKWGDILERVTLNEMPPETEKRPSAAQTEKVVAWLKIELHKAGVDAAEADRKLGLPGHGNRVDHAALFSGEHKGPAYSPSRLWRMSPQIYSTFVPRVTGSKGGGKVAQPFSTSSAEGFKDFADLFVIDEPTISQLMRNAKQIVELQTVKSTQGKVVPEFAALVAADHVPSAAEVQTAIRKQFQMALLREPTAEEVKNFSDLMDQNIKASGNVIGAKNTLATILMLPEALYRHELGDGKFDQHGRRFLSPRELAYAISFALTDGPPDAALLKVVADGKLKTKEDVHREVRRILDDKSIAKPRVNRFFEEYFEYPAVLDVFKDFSRGGWRPEVLLNDTRLLVQHILDEDKDVFRQLLTTNKSFVNAKLTGGALTQGVVTKQDMPKPNQPPKPRKMDYADLYNLPPDWKWTDKQPIELPKEERAGILTQPSWLAAFATNNETHAIRRGKWVRERLLGNVVPDLPISVDAQLPDTPEKTIRERMSITQQEYCWQCHQKMNNLGLPFEMYDFVGLYRKTEKVVDPAVPPKKSTNKPTEYAYREVPLNTAGTVELTGDPSVEGPVKDAIELVRRLAETDRARQVFIRHAFRYWMGRNEMLSDSPTLLAADKAYLASGGSMKALIASLLTSDSFLYRKDQPK
jgi:mono/diheme cytochrome c family protein